MTYVRASDGARIHYRVTGRPGAPPILFIQGLGADKHGWDLQRLATSPWYQAVALDNRGAGLSDKPRGEYSLEQMADDAIAVLDDAGVDTAHVVGASMGGAISQIIAGVEWVTQNAPRPAVVNMSLGGVATIPALDDAVAASIAAGITYVIAAGNSELDTCTTSPGRVPGAITVAASNPNGERATGWGGTQPGSNFGPCVDLFAPGEQVKSSYNASDRATRVQRGTSLAAPHVAGAAALILSKYPDATPAEVSAMIVNSATVGAINPATLRGTPDRLLYISDVIDPPVRPAVP